MRAQGLCRPGSLGLNSASVLFLFTCHIPKGSEWLTLPFNRSLTLGKFFCFGSLGFHLCKMGITIELASSVY